MDYPRTNKKVKYTLVAQVAVNPGEDAQVDEILKVLREVGEAEVVDVDVVDPDEDEE